MLTPDIIKTIESFVYSKPRSLIEVAQKIDKSWRTADRYVKEIEKEYGTISTRTFREGTRGALKVVYWASLDKISNTAFQEILEKDILQAKTKDDFSPFEIYQFVEDNLKDSIMLKEEGENLDDFIAVLKKAKKNIFFLSGNLSFINPGNGKMLRELEKLVSLGVSIKVICRVDVAGMKNVEKLLSLNHKLAKEAVQIHHSYQPIRGVIIDNNFLRIKEIKNPTNKINELSEQKTIIYNVWDKEWVEWMNRIFWKIFSHSVDSNVRLLQLKKVFG